MQSEILKIPSRSTNTRSEIRKPEFEVFHSKKKALRLMQKEELDILTQIQKLLPHIFEKILSYVPNRRYSALVNKYFYKAVCKVDNNENIYRFHCDGKLGEKSFFEVIESSLLSNRQVSEVCCSDLLLINEMILPSIISVLSKFSSSLRKLELDTCLITDDQLCVMLSKIPDIEELSVVNCRVKRQNTESVDFKMKKLLKLDLSRTLYIQPSSSDDSLLEKLFMSLTKNSQLETFSASGDLLAIFPFDKKKLNHLKMDKTGPEFLRIADVIESQFRLKSLDVLDCFIMDDVLFAISRTLPHLKSLKLQLNGVSMKGFASLKFLQLKSLHIKAGKVKWIASITSMVQFQYVEDFYLSVEDILMSNGGFEAMFMEMVNVKKIHVKTNSVHILETIFKHSTHLKKNLKSCTIEFANLNLLKNLPSFEPKFETSIGLEELTIINIDEKLAQQTNFSFLRFFGCLKKLTLNGFHIDRNLHFYAMNYHFELQYLELREIKAKHPTYIFDSLADSHGFSGSLKCIKIDCSAYKLLRAYTVSQFPIVERLGFTQILRYR